MVAALVDTLYPFSDTLSTTIAATQAFTYYVRIPSWVVGGTIAVGDGETKVLTPSDGLQAVFISVGMTRLSSTFPRASLQVGSRRRNIPADLRFLISLRLQKVDFMLLPPIVTHCITPLELCYYTFSMVIPPLVFPQFQGPKRS